MPTIARPVAGRTCSQVDPDYDGPEGVHLSTGEYVLQTVDLHSPGVGLDFQWVRTYRSRSGASSALGHGWTHAYDLTIRVSGDDLLVTDGGGREDVYAPDADGQYTHAEFQRVVNALEDGGYEVVFPNGGRWLFSPADVDGVARVQSILDRFGNALQFDYDGLGRLDRITDTVGGVYTISYDGSGRLASIADDAGRVVRYGYLALQTPDGPDSGDSDLVSCTGPAVVGTPNGNDYPDGKTTRYVYAGGKGSVLDHNLVRVIAPSGDTVLANTYGQSPGEPSFDRVVRQEVVAGTFVDVHYASEESILASSAPSLVITNDGVGNVAEHYYDAQNRRVRLLEYTGRAIPGIPTTPTTNRPQNPLRPDDPTYFETLWSYNAYGLVTQETTPNGTLRQMVYEVDLDPQASPLSRANLREQHWLPGTHTPVGDQPSHSEYFEYLPGQGGCCGSQFMTRHTDRRGNVVTYDYDAAGNMIAAHGREPGVLTEYTYDSLGRVTSMTHPDDGTGHRRVDLYTYYPLGTGGQSGLRQAEIVDANGLALTTTYTYDALGQVQSVTDPGLGVTLVDVNALGQVTRVRLPELAASTGGTYRITRLYWYDANDRLIRTTIDNLDGQGQVQPNAEYSVDFQFDPWGRPIRDLVEIDASRTVVIERAFDANGNMTLLSKGEAVAGGQPENVVAYEYDERDLPFRQREAAGHPDQSSSQKDYDGNENLRRVIRGLESSSPVVETYVHDAFDRLYVDVDGVGTSTQRHYDANNNLLELEVVGTDQSGGGPARLSRATHAYDSMDRLVVTAEDHFGPTQTPIGDGLMTRSLSWSPASQLLLEVDDLGNAVTYGYDTAGRKAWRLDPEGNGELFEYDAQGNLTRHSEYAYSEVRQAYDVHVTEQEFDALNRLVVVRDPKLRETRLEYDSRGFPLARVDTRGNRSRWTFDGGGRPTSRAVEMTSDGTGAGTLTGVATTTMVWDDSTRLVALTDPNGNTTRYAYDGADRPIVTQEPDGTLVQIGSGALWPLGVGSPDLSAFTNGYDPHGNPVLATDAAGTVATSVFDGRDRLASTSLQPGPGVSPQTTFELFVRDGLGRVTTGVDDDSVLTIRYDSASNVVLDDVNGAAAAAVHDGVGNMVHLDYPGGRAVDFLPDKIGNVQATLEGGSFIGFYQYLGTDRIERRYQGNLTVTEDTYDVDKGILGIRHASMQSGTAYAELSFQWDGQGNKTLWADALGFGRSRSLSYDSQDRLWTSTDLATGASTGYTLDLAGNRQQVAGGAFSGSYALSPVLPEPADFQQNQYTTTPLGGRTHDKRGATTALVTATGSWNLTYDARAQLVQAADASGSILETYEYDVLGRRIVRRTQGPSGTSEVRYAHHLDRVIEERDAGGATLATYVHGNYVDELLTMRRGGVDYYVHTDDLYSTVAVTDGAGAVVERYDYDDFGHPLIMDAGGSPRAASAIGNPFLFQGRAYDEVTGLYEFRNRYVDPAAGRFVTRDPGGKWGDPYGEGVALSFLDNDPYSLVDPFGFQGTRPRDSSEARDTLVNVHANVCGAISVIVAACGGPAGVVAYWGLWWAGTYLLDILIPEDEWCLAVCTESTVGAVKVGEAYCLPCPGERCPTGTATLSEWEGQKAKIVFKYNTVADSKTPASCDAKCDAPSIVFVPLSSNASTGSTGQTHDVRSVETGR